MVTVFGSQMSFGVFFKPMLNEFGWTRAGTAGPFSLSMVLMGALAFVSGRLGDRFGPRKVVTAGAILVGLGYLLTSRISDLWQLYLFYGVIIAIGAGSIYVPLVSLITRWFGKRRGLMAGISISGIGIGLAVVPTIATHLIETYTWRGSLIIVGIVNLVLTVILAQFLRSEPDNTNPAEFNGVTAGKPLPQTRTSSLKEIAKTKQFWLIFSAWFVYGFFFQVGSVHIVPYATDLGLSAIAAASILTTIGIAGTVGRISLGVAGDRFSNKTAIFASFALLALAFFGLFISASVPALYIFALIYGCVSGFGILLTPLVAERFGLSALGAVTGAIVFANSAGGAIGPTLAGYIFDTTGSYHLAFLICVILAFFGSIIFWVIEKKG
jgi:MFS family permease